MADEIEKQPQEDVALDQSSELDMIELSDGADLDVISGFDVTASSRTNVIVLAGPAGCGKTTLVASLYEKFQEGPFGGYLFAGSQTLLGFERRCYLARITSLRDHPTTERTKPGGGQKFLHFRLRNADLVKGVQDLLLSDISGELFSLAKDSTEECKRLEILHRADHFVLFIDGDKLAKIDSRGQAFNDAALLFRSCLDAQMIHKESLIDVVFTKWDKVLLSPTDHKTLDFVRHVETSISDRFKKRVSSLTFFRVAARPGHESGLSFGYGLSDLLKTWVENVPVYVPQTIGITCSSADNEFDRFSFRQPPSSNT